MHGIHSKFSHGNASFFVAIPLSVSPAIQLVFLWRWKFGGFVLEDQNPVLSSSRSGRGVGLVSLGCREMEMIGGSVARVEPDFFQSVGLQVSFVHCEGLATRRIDERERSIFGALGANLSSAVCRAVDHECRIGNQLLERSRFEEAAQ